MWTDKFAESKLEYDVKTYNAKKSQGEGTPAQPDTLAKPHTDKKSMQQSPAKKPSEPQPPSNKHNNKDSLSSFTSDDEVKPGKCPSSIV